jgi:hypothetical protein
MLGKAGQPQWAASLQAAQVSDLMLPLNKVLHDGMFFLIPQYQINFR